MLWSHPRGQNSDRWIIILRSQMATGFALYLCLRVSNIFKPQIRTSSLGLWWNVRENHTIKRIGQIPEPSSCKRERESSVPKKKHEKKNNWILIWLKDVESYITYRSACQAQSNPASPATQFCRNPPKECFQCLPWPFEQRGKASLAESLCKLKTSAHSLGLTPLLETDWAHRRAHSAHRGKHIQCCHSALWYSHSAWCSVIASELSTETSAS